MDDQKSSYRTGPLTNQSTIKDALRWITILILVGQGIVMILFLNAGMMRQFYVLGGGMLPMLLALELNRREKTQLAGSLIAVSLTLLITFLATLSRGIYDVSTIAYPAILIMASLILRRNITIVLTIFVVICIGWLVFGNMYGLFHIQSLEIVSARQFIIAAVILIITAFAVQLLADTVRTNALTIQHELEEREKIEKVLRETEELYRNMVEETSVITYRDTAEKESRTIYVSPQLETVLGYSQAEWSEHPKLWLDLIHPDDLPRVLSEIESYLEKGGRSISEYRMKSKNGRWIWFQDEAVVVKDEQGKPKYIHGVLIDITERKDAESKVYQREKILSAVARTAQLLLSSSNWRDEIDAILKLLGEATEASHVYIFENHPGPEGKTLSSQIFEWVAPGMKPEINNPVYQNMNLIPGPGLEDWYENLRNGKPFYGSGSRYSDYWKKVFEARGLKTILDMPIYVEGIWWGVIGFDDYINEMPWSQVEIDALVAAAGNLGTAMERQQSDEALRRSEEKFQLAFHRTFVPMAISRARDDIILDVNQAFCNIMGYTREESTGKTAMDLRLWINIEERASHMSRLGKQGYAQETKAVFRSKNGDTGVALISAVKIYIANEPCYLHTIYDISKIDQLLNELKAKNEELEKFTYTVSHDLRAPLVTISGFMGYLQQDVQKGDIQRASKDILRINEAVAKMQRLLSELLELSRIGRLMNPPEEVPFMEIVREALSLVEGRLQARPVQVEVEADLPTVYGDRVRLVEVIQNLVDNAAKFMGDQGQPKIEIGVQYQGKTPVFHVRDNGIGIESEQQQRVFELFNKLDAGSEGTGIGLALVKRIIEVHGGKIWVESDGNGKGATFLFTLSNRLQQGTS